MIEAAFLKVNLNSAKSICKNGWKSFTDFDPEEKANENCFSVYLATNENCAYFPDMTSFVGKDVLSVTGSGDQVLNSVFFGANSVETFDVNYLTFLFYDLKQTALLRLSREDFLNFYDEANLFPKQLYDKISDSLQPATKLFFDELFSFVENRDGLYKSRTRYLRSQTPSLLCNLCEEFTTIQKNLMENNPYLASKRTYRATQKRLNMLKQPVLHKFCPAHKLAEKFGKKDIIIMSNILRYYMQRSYSSQQAYFTDKGYHPGHNFGAKDVINSVFRTLKDDGVASLLYMYSSLYSSNYANVLQRDYNVQTETIRAEKKQKVRAVDTVLIAKKSQLQSPEDRAASAK